MCTLITHDLDAVEAALMQANVVITKIEANSIPPFVGSRGIFCLGRAGERVEFIEVKKA